jgi:serine/threonine protein kinase
MPPADVARVGAAVAGALAAVHSYGLVHRDIKPANILISTTGDVKLSDFGIARDLEAERLTAAADVIGTAAYLSPEQARGAEVGPPTDVYALGLVLLECLTGRREYPGRAVESAVARLLRDPVVPNELPGSWPPLLRAMTQADPARRPTAAEVEGALTGRVDVIAAPPATATLPQPVPVLPPTQAKKPSAGKTFAITLLVLAVTAGIIVGVVALIQRNTGTDSPVVATTPPTSSSTPPSVVTTTERTTETTRESPSTTSTSSTPTTSSAPTTPTTTRTTPTTATTPPTTPTTPSSATAPPSTADNTAPSALTAATP